MSQTTVKVQIQQRIDTSSNWTSAGTTVLLSGEIGWESNTGKFKIGDGSTAWSSLAYAPGAGGYTAGTGVAISASNVISASAIALSQVFTAANQTAHLALTTQEGDIVVRSDENKSYVRNSGSASDMTDYTLLATPTDAVLSVNGNTGAITADQLAAAIESATDSNTFSDADHTKLNSLSTTPEGTAIISTGESGGTKFLREDGDGSCSWQSATVDISGKANLSGATFTGQINAPNAVFTDDGATGAVVSIQGDDAQQWGFHIGNSTYHNSQASGLKSYIQDDGDLELAHYANAEYRNWWISQHDGTTGRYNIYCTTAGSLYLYNSGNIRLTTTAAGVTVTGTVTDSKGDLRDIVQNVKTSAYTLVASDAGKCVQNSSGGWTIPASTFSGGNAVTLLNNSASDQNITATALTYLWNTADGANIKANTIVLGARTLATIWFMSGAEGYIQAGSITVS